MTEQLSDAEADLIAEPHLLLVMNGTEDQRKRALRLLVQSTWRDASHAAEIKGFQNATKVACEVIRGPLPALDRHTAQEAS